MDKKAKKRDISTFASNLKDLMNDPLDNPLTTLDRDIQHFIYARVALLIKHNEDKPIGSLNDVGAVTGAACCSVIAAFCQNRIDDKSIDEIFSAVRDNLVQGFNARIPSQIEVEDTKTDDEPKTDEKELTE